MADLAEIAVTIADVVSTGAVQLLMDSSSEDDSGDEADFGGELDQLEESRDLTLKWLFPEGDTLLAMDETQYLNRVRQLKSERLKEVLARQGDSDTENKIFKGVVEVSGVRLSREGTELLAYYLVNINPDVTAIRITRAHLKPETLAILSWAIAQCNVLEHVHLNGHRKLKNGLRYVLPAVWMAPSVKTLALRDNKLVDDAGVLGKLLAKDDSQLKALDLGGNKLSFDGMKCIAEGLTHNTTLEELHLDKNGLSPEAVIMLAEGLGDSSPLTVLNLQHNDLGPDGAPSLETVLQNIDSLERVQLGGNELGDEGIALIAKAVAAHPNITHLDLSDNELSRASEDVARMIANTDRLLHLNLADNLIDESNGLLICAGLKQNTSIRRLDMSRNTFQDLAGVAIGDMLENNDTLEELVLEGNDISDSSAESIADALVANNALRFLDLSHNDIHSPGANKLARVLAMSENTTLKRLELDGNPIQARNISQVHLANSRGVTGPSMAHLNITLHGANIAASSLHTFGVRLPKSEAHTSFSKALLVVAVLTNWMDIGSDILVVSELQDAAAAGEVSYFWMVLSCIFLTTPTLYMVLYMSSPELPTERAGRETVLNAVLTTFQLRVAYEAYKSAQQRLTTTRLGSIRVVEAAVESGPQAFLQLTFLLYLAVLKPNESPFNPIVIFSVSLSLLVLGQTYSDLFEKQYVILSHRGDEGLELFMRLLPCSVFHICQFSYRVLTFGLLMVMLQWYVALSMILFAIGSRFLLREWTHSKRSWTFCVLVTFVANSAWDHTSAVLMGLLLSTVETSLALALLMLNPGTLLSGPTASLFWASDLDLGALDPVFLTALVASLYGVHLLIFFAYIFPLHRYDSWYSQQELEKNVEDQLATIHPTLSSGTSSS